MYRALRKNSAAYNILKIVAAAPTVGIAVATFATAPGLTLIVGELLESVDEEEYRRRRLRLQKQISAATQRLRQRRFVRYEERGKETYLVITQGGLSEIKKFEFEELAIYPSARWDGKWRLVLFDIPEQYKSGREALRRKLSILGFYPFQKSVFAFPHECRDEVEFIAHFCEVERYVYYVLCHDLGHGEIDVRKNFGLLLHGV